MTQWMNNNDDEGIDTSEIPELGAEFFIDARLTRPGEGLIEGGKDMGQWMKACELQLGDVVKVFDGEFGTAIVNQVKDGVVHFFRPYGVSADFVHTGGVICYMAAEHFTRFATTEDFYVYRRDKRLNPPERRSAHGRD